MGTLYIDRKGITIKLDGNALAFYVSGKHEGSVPMMPLKRVILVGNVIIESPVLNRLADEQIAVIFLSGRRLRFHGMLHGRLHNNGLLRVKQYEKSLSENSSSFPCEISCEIVERKIQGQSAFLKDAVEKRPDLRFPLTTAIHSLSQILEKLTDRALIPGDDDEGRQGGILESLRGYEGGAAAVYFSAYTTLFADSLHFTKRNRRPPEDPVNAMLSLCYTMIHYEIVREIEVVGLDPTIGFYHQFEYGRESLACDLVELFRPTVDGFVWSIFRERELAARDFAYETDRDGCYLKKGGRQRFYFLYEEWAKKVRRDLRGEVRMLAHRIAEGADFLPDDEEVTYVDGRDCG